MVEGGPGASDQVSERGSVTHRESSLSSDVVMATYPGRSLSLEQGDTQDVSRREPGPENALGECGLTSCLLWLGLCRSADSPGVLHHG